MTTQATDLTIRKTLDLECTPERAFETFTAGISSWWPLTTHSVGEERVVRAVVEPREGGRVYEVWDDGEEREWGRLLAWEPPHRLVWSWQPNPDRPAATEVEVRFHANGAGTRLELEHRAWERLGEEGPRVRENYQTGWDAVLSALPGRAAAS